MASNDASGRATSDATPMSGGGGTSTGGGGAGGGGAGATDVSAAFALTLSVVSSVSIVIVNKHLISILGFREGGVRDATRVCFSCVLCFASVRRARDDDDDDDDGVECFAETFPE